MLAPVRWFGFVCRWSFFLVAALMVYVLCFYWNSDVFEYSLAQLTLGSIITALIARGIGLILWLWLAIWAFSRDEKIYEGWAMLGACVGCCAIVLKALL